MGYAIRGVDRLDEMHARGIVEVSIRDFRAIVGEISGALEAAACHERAHERVSFIRRNVGAIERKFEAEGVPKRTLQQNIELIRDGRQWKVPAGWGLEGSRRS